MDDTLPNTTVSTDATLFREEAERARRYAAAMTDRKVIDRLNEIAALYDELAAGQDPGQPIATNRVPARGCRTVPMETVRTRDCVESAVDGGIDHVAPESSIIAPLFRRRGLCA